MHVRVVAGEKSRDVGSGAAVAAPRQAARGLLTNLRVRVVDALPQRRAHRVAVDGELPAEAEGGPVADLGIVVTGHIDQEIDARTGRIVQQRPRHRLGDRTPDLGRGVTGEAEQRR